MAPAWTGIAHESQSSREDPSRPLWLHVVERAGQGLVQEVRPKEPCVVVLDIAELLALVTGEATGS